MIILNRCYYKEILAHGINELPNEACGLIAGRIKDGDKIIEKVYLLSNADHSPEHFSMEPQEQFTAVKDMRKNGLVLLGNFHSHPASPARPSQEDIRLAFAPDYSYLILSLMEQENPVLKSFKIVDREVSAEELIIGGE
ncbi:MAG: M67 family metallopeptidase [Syntrophomonadaceae bacterium]|nr:M67 family metallopeptidase [Syntrophomonadaceae bacterium]